jgi:hypothetical protein
LIERKKRKKSGLVRNSPLILKIVNKNPLI